MFLAAIVHDGAKRITGVPCKHSENGTLLGGLVCAVWLSIYFQSQPPKIYHIPQALNLIMCGATMQHLSQHATPQNLQWKSAMSSKMQHRLQYHFVCTLFVIKCDVTAKKSGSKQGSQK